MRLLLFTLLCILTILFLRVIRRGARSRVPGPSEERRPDPPVVRSDEIVDVPFEELPDDAKTRKGAP
jgi:hypothetical protein